MKILHTIPPIWRDMGGPAEVVPLLCQHLSAHGTQVSLATLSGPLSDAAVACGQKGVTLRTFPVSFFKGMPWFSLPLHSGVRKLVSQSDIIHVNSMWTHTNWCTSSHCLKQGKPYIVSFHGAIMNSSKWSIKHKIAWKLLDGHYIKQANCIHACTEEELKSIRSRGLKNPVAVIPYGIETWKPPSKESLEELMSECSGRKTFLFFSRIHPDKGVYDLVMAWSKLNAVGNGWQLLIAGPGLPSHIKKLKNLILSEGVDDQVKYLGPLFGDMRTAAYCSCDVLVLPSYTENFGVVVGEALACGKPVLVTQAVPWPDLLRYKCGWVVPNNIASLSEMLQEIMLLKDEELKSMGSRGRDIVLEKYTWPVVSRKMLKTYKWVIGQGAMPEWVDIC